MTDPMQRLAAALAGRYRVERELGRGGMATVYLAEDMRHARRVAIKVLDPEVAGAIGPDRFVREIETVARLTHPHILPLHDSGLAGGLLYYVMPYVPGGSLRQRLAREGPLPVAEVLRLAREVADALDHAHRAGLVHRDIKPENILLEAGHAVVADFGLACAQDPASSGRLTTVGVTLGTPAYMSPEQAAGSGEVDGRSDQYSLACTVYELLAGEPPFTGPSAQGLMRRHLHEAPRPVTALRPGLPAAVRDALARALAKEPAERYASSMAFAAALAAESGPARIEDPEFAPTGEMVATPPREGATPRPRETPARAPSDGDGRRKLPAVALSLGAVVLLVVLAALAAWLRWPPFAGEQAAPSVGRAWTLVAEFDSAPEDSMVAMATRDLLTAALDQSKLVATVPPDQVRQALQLAGRPAGTRVDAAVAHELAYRSAVRTVLEGKLGRLGPAYTIVLRLVDADSARVILTETVTAKNAGALVTAVEELAKRLRRGLGENWRALATTRELSQVATPSFEAYKLYAEGSRVSRSLANRRALYLYRAAIARDPGFALAWLAMSRMYTNLGSTDSSRACLEQALRYPDRLTASQRMRLDLMVAENDGDQHRAQVIIESLLAEQPDNLYALNMSAVWLLGMGRFEESLERYRRVVQLSPFGAGEIVWIYLAYNLRCLGRFDEAREALSHLQGVYKTAQLADLEIAANRAAVAESIMTRNLNDARWNEEMPGGPLNLVARVQFARGALLESAAHNAQAAEAANRASDGGAALYWARMGLEFASIGGGAYPLPPEPLPRDTSAMSVVTRGLWGTVAGDLALAHRCAEDVRARPARMLADQGVGPPLLGARVATLEGRPQEAVDLLREKAMALNEPGMPQNSTGLNWARWSLADAFDQLGRPDSAATCLELTIRVPFAAEVRPAFHCRLALLYARMHRVADAERHLAAAEEAWDRPDPAVRRMLDEARAVVRRAGVAARPR
jgi:eukaryotic-like serine/threonine-protein kinase